MEVIVGWIVKAWDNIPNDITENSFKLCGLTNNLDRSEDKQITIFKDNKCCAGHLKEFWDQLDSKTLVVNVKEVGHEEMNQDVYDFIDISEDLCIIIEKDS